MSPSPARRAILPLLLLGFILTCALPAMADSYYPDRINDPRAVYLDAPEFGAKGDGTADDTTALQNAINAVVERNGQGILFVPPGTYRITQTIKIWPGVRVIGFGPQRPKIILGDNTPGFQSGIKPMFWFTGNVPGQRGHEGFRFLQPTNITPEKIDFTGKVNDANPGTFYSALSNIDLAIGAGNPAAACVRAHYAQHCYLAHIRFDIGSGLTGIYDGGNFAQDLQFIGGKFGIITHKTAPSWQFTLVDCTFSGQTTAAIQTEQAGLTLIRPQFKNVPTAITINPGMAEELWIKDGYLENISGPAFIISNENSARTQISMENVACKNVPIFAQYRESGKQLAGKGDLYVLRHYVHGLKIYLFSLTSPEIIDVFDSEAAIAKPVPSDIPALPPPAQWTNVHDLGVKGDGVTDDTAALKAAVAAHRVLYFPCGAYVLTDTLKLQPDSILIGLHPSATRFYLPDNTPAFAGNGKPVPLIEAPAGGNAIVTGLGIETGGINPRAVGLLWKSGPHSLVNDVRFLGGHGTSQLDGHGQPVYNQDHSGDPNPARQWNVQPASLWITDNGGGTFTDIWTPNTYAKSGLLITHTTTPGRIYELSSEHHVDNEIILDHVENWQLYALQTEEERGESGHCVPLQITNCKHLTFANTFNYRVVSSDHPASTAIRLDDSANIRFFNTHCYSDSRVGFENLLTGLHGTLNLRQREVGFFCLDDDDLDLGRNIVKPMGTMQIAFQKIASGYSRISGLAVDPGGLVYFVDVPAQKIFRYDPAKKSASLVTDKIQQPMNLALDRSGKLLVITYDDKVYTLDPTQPGQFAQLSPEPTTLYTNADYVLPCDVWRNENDFARFITAPRAQEIVSPDGSTVIPIEDDFLTGKLYYGAKMHELLRAFGLQKVAVGKTAYICDEMELKTYAITFNADGTRTEPKLFVEDGGESVATDSAGNVFIASGNVNVYGADGQFKGTIITPERPLALAFAPDGTLYAAAGTALYRCFPGLNK